MYQITITIDSEEDGNMGATGISIRTLQDLSQRPQGEYATSLQAAELGTALAWSRFVRDVAAHMPRIIAADPEHLDGFEEVVEHFLDTVLESLIDGAGDAVSEHLGLDTKAPARGAQEPVDWNMVFRNMAMGTPPEQGG